MASVTYYSNNYGGRQLRLVLNQNKTTINWTLYSEGGGSNTFYTVYNVNIVIAGQTVYNPGTVGWSTEKFPAAKGSTGGRISVTKGTTSVVVTFQGTVYYNRSTNYGGTFTLDTTYNAPRYNSIASNPSRTSVVLTASINTDGASITSGGWDVSTNGGSTWTYYNGGPTNKTITGLTPNTQYWYRGHVTTAGGSANSNWGNFTTTGNAPVANSILVSNISRTSATLSVSASYDTNASNKSTTYQYGTTTNYGNSTGASMIGLTPNTTYYVRGQVTDNWNRTSGWATGSFKTTGNVPSIISHGVQTYGQTTVTMEYSASYDTNDSLSSYKWDIGTSTSYGTTFTNTNSLTGLDANTTYYYKLTVTSSQGRNSTATGSFKTDYATQQVTSIIAEDITETSISGRVNVPNPTWLTNLTIWIYSGDTLINTITKTSNITATNDFLFEDLSPGTVYEIRARTITKTQNSSGGYNSSIKTLAVVTVDANPIHVIKSDGTDKKYKMYVMGKGNIYEPSIMGWQNGYYATGTIGQAIGATLTQSTEVNGGAAASTTFLEILPNISYTITNNDIEVDFVIHGTDSSNNITTTGYTISPGQSYEYTGTTSTNRLWISIKSSTNSVVNYATAKFFRLNIFRTIEKTLIPKDNIVYINGKIRYIDIIQAGSNFSDPVYAKFSAIVALKVYDAAGNDIALNKTVSMIKGKNPTNLERVTNGNIDTDNYARIEGKTVNDLETIIRVDLGKDYTDIDHVILWRYYGDGRTYLNTKLYGRDATTRLTWKFHDFRNQGEYAETSSGYNFTIRHEIIEGVPIILSVLQEPNNSTNTIIGTKLTINADWLAVAPPVLDSWISYRTDAILAANQGRLLKTEIGNLSELTTTAKDSLVDAINEVWYDYKGSDKYTNILNALLNAILIK